MTTHALTDDPRARLLIRKLDWRLLPFLLICYIFAALDRINIGFAKLTMQSDLGLSDAAYGMAAGVFFIGYMMIEIPSNLMFPKFGARKTFRRILILWGFTSAGMMFVHNETTFYAMRFLLGLFEAGFAPGMIFYLTYWYGRSNIGRAMGIVLMAGPIASVISGPLSGAIISHMGGIGGLAGWQWMFLIQGLPCVGLGLLVPLILSDKPEDADWLSADEKARVIAARGSTWQEHHSFRKVAKDPVVLMMAFVLFCLLCVTYANAFWLPTIISASGVSNPMTVGWLSAIPSAVACLAMMLAGRFSDRSGDRSRLVGTFALISAAALAGATFLNGNLPTLLAFITLAISMTYASYAVFWAVPSDYLKGNAAAGGIGLINTVGLFGGFVSPNIIGMARTMTGSTKTGMGIVVVILAAGGLMAFAVRAAMARPRRSPVSLPDHPSLDAKPQTTAPR